MPSSVWRDDFNRADGKVGIALSGQSYLSGSGSWAISSSYLVTSASGDTIGGDLGITDFSFNLVSAAPNPSSQIEFRVRYTDPNNFISFTLYFGAILFNKMVSGTITQVGTASINNPGFTTLYTAQLIGPNLTFTANNSAPFTYSFTDTGLMSGSKFYLVNDSVSKYNLDNLVVYNAPIARPAIWIVAPSGSDAGDGTLANPMSWTGSMGNPLIQGDDHIQLRAGEYCNTLAYFPGITPTLSGSVSHSIIVERYLPDVTTPNTFPHVHVGLNWNSSYGYVDYYDIDFGGNDPTRKTGYGASPPYSPLFSLSIHAPGIRFLNCISHDFASDGMDMWEGAPNGMYYGCCVFNNGFMQLYTGDGVTWVFIPAGVGTYTQNDQPPPDLHKFIDNFIWHNWNLAFQAYGSSGAQIANYFVQGNTYFYGSGKEFLAGGLGSSVVSNFTFDSNIMYSNNGVGTQMGYTARKDSNCTVTNNYMVNEVAGLFYLFNFDSAIVSGNTMVQLNRNTGLMQFGWNSGSLYAIAPTSGVFDFNTYITAPITISQSYHFAASYGLNGAGQANYNFNTISTWNSLYGYDSHSVLYESPPTGSYVLLRPNMYRPNTVNVDRAHITIVNWSTATQIPVDVSKCLQLGDTWALWNLYNWVPNYNADGTVQAPRPPDQTGIYLGQPILVNLTKVSTPPIVSNNIMSQSNFYYPVLNTTPNPGRPSCYVLVQTGHSSSIPTNIRPKPPQWKQWLYS